VRHNWVVVGRLNYDGFLIIILVPAFRLQMSHEISSKTLRCKYFGSLFLQCCIDGNASLIKKCLVAWRILCCGIFNDAFIESVHVYNCIHVVVVPHQLTCRRCTEFNYVSAAPDYMVRKKIRQKVARQLITSIVMLWTNLQHLQFLLLKSFLIKLGWHVYAKRCLPHIYDWVNFASCLLKCTVTCRFSPKFHYWC